jgi:hypothetical protein
MFAINGKILDIFGSNIYRGICRELPVIIMGGRLIAIFVPRRRGRLHPVNDSVPDRIFERTLKTSTSSLRTF